MTTRLLLEGDDLVEIVAQVREELGPRARIVRAERVRTGGFAGFFTTERFEVTVDVPDDPVRLPRAAAPRPAPVPPGGLDGLLAAADAADGPGGPPGGAEPEQPGPAAVSTTSREFAAVLDQVRTLVGVPVAPDAAPAPRAWAGRPGASAAAAPGTAVPSATVPSATVPSATGPSAAGQRPGLLPKDAPPTARRAAPAPPTAVPTTPAAPGAPAGAGGLRAELVRLGVPARLLDPGPVTLGAVLGRLPEPPAPPRGVGQVLVVVGEGDGPLTVARTLAVRWRLPDARVHDVDAAGTVVPPPRDGGTAQIVALRVGQDHQDRARAARALALLAGDQVWAVTDARTKSADVAAWVATVGVERPVDALAVHGLLDTAAPGTVLETGLPVAWVDGVPASRLVWAAALGQELDAALA